jgi:hypothetical protein
VKGLTSSTGLSITRETEEEINFDSPKTASRISVLVKRQTE